MKINGGVSMGNIWTIVVTVLAMAVVWGSSQTKIEYIDEEIKSLRLKKANKDVIEVKLEVMSSDIAEIKQLIKEMK
tara:strand:+ start:205 stop:432 length:228 start_codon:yes stop_codon:yes gene_type:complete